MCDIIYSGYDVINIVGAMRYKQSYDVFKRGCDVINRVGVISSIYWCDHPDTDMRSVMSYIVVVLS